MTPLISRYIYYYHYYLDISTARCTLHLYLQTDHVQWPGQGQGAHRVQTGNIIILSIPLTSPQWFLSSYGASVLEIFWTKCCSGTRITVFESGGCVRADRDTGAQTRDRGQVATATAGKAAVLLLLLLLMMLGRPCLMSA